AKFYDRWSSDTAASSSFDLLQDWKTLFTVEAGSTTFYHVAGLGGGLTEVKGDVHTSPTTLVAHATVAFQSIPVQTAASALGVPEFSEGKLTGFARFNLAISSHPWTGLAG